MSDTLFKRGFAHIDRGDTLVAYSDGLVERESANGEEFGEAGIEAVVAARAGENAAVVLRALVQAAEKHGAARPWDDDTTVVVVSRERPAPSS